MRIAVLGLGEAGGLYASALARTGHDVAGYDPAAVLTPADVRRTASVADAVVGADFVLALTGAASAAAVAAEAAPALSSTACYADLSTSSPAVKRVVERAVSGHAGSVADVAVLAPVPRRGVSTPLLVSGSGGPRVAEVFADADVEVLDAPVGAAAERRLLRSVFMKGLAATVLEAVTAGAAAGCEDWVREQIANELGNATTERLITGTRAHAARRVHEMRAARDHLVELGTPTAICDASLTWLSDIANDIKQIEEDGGAP